MVLNPQHPFRVHRTGLKCRGACENKDPLAGIKIAFRMAASSGAGKDPEMDDEDESAAVAAAEARMQSVQRGFAAAKAAGVPAATRLMKELRQVCLTGTFEVELVQDDLQVWQVICSDIDRPGAGRRTGRT